VPKKLHRHVCELASPQNRTEEEPPHTWQHESKREGGERASNEINISCTKAIGSKLSRLRAIYYGEDEDDGTNERPSALSTVFMCGGSGALTLTCFLTNGCGNDSEYEWRNICRAIDDLCTSVSSNSRGAAPPYLKSPRIGALRPVAQCTRSW